MLIRGIQSSYNADRDYTVSHKVYTINCQFKIMKIPEAKLPFVKKTVHVYQTRLLLPVPVCVELGFLHMYQPQQHMKTGFRGRPEKPTELS